MKKSTSMGHATVLLFKLFQGHMMHDNTEHGNNFSVRYSGSFKMTNMDTGVTLLSVTM